MDRYIDEYMPHINNEKMNYIVFGISTKKYENIVYKRQVLQYLEHI